MVMFVVKRFGSVFTQPTEAGTGGNLVTASEDPKDNTGKVIVQI